MDEIKSQLPLGFNFKLLAQIQLLIHNQKLYIFKFSELYTFIKIILLFAFAINFTTKQIFIISLQLNNIL